MKVRIAHTPDRFGVDIWVYDENPDGSFDIWLPMILEVQHYASSPNEHIEPTFQFADTVGDGFLAALSEALIEAGYRDKAVSKDGEIMRMENHLNDMRKLVFKEKKVS